jgi:hypothetical protein
MYRALYGIDDEAVEAALDTLQTVQVPLDGDTAEKTAD